MSDDEQFEAFLHGEDALARQLQALAQPAPPPALDAAILARARAAVEQERPRAANDEAPPAPAARHPARLGWRWQVPAGIAATVLAGLIARQSFESDTGVNVHEAAPTLEAAMPQERAAPPAPAVAVAPAPDGRRDAAPAPAAVAPSASGPSRAVVSRADKVPARSAQRPPPPAPAPSVAPAPPAAMAPAPLAESIIAPPPPPNEAAREATASRYRATLSARGFGEVQAPPASYQQDGEAKGAPHRAPVFPHIATDRAVPVHAEAVAAPPPEQEAASVMLARIEALLAAGKQAEAASEWKKLRALHPGYPVPDSTREKLGAD
ncbi:hypothetical protein KY495_22495 [Massilia sp. PAMC28688]|uniref:hypothetical protein n=1 Tax=Massilia sp. PAMC28688 TaxID=2861283 RepID=UPI001C624D20|nr:hypothetical protein [Massilia sp. PAMC28688]QYF93406.1 hypothetical protein KY495_22495 [Massilia sp. PAMC28688]